MSDGTAFADDFLGRKAIADRLTAVLESSEAPLSLSVSGDWGVGKSVFLTDFAKLLAARGHLVVTFDAFEADHFDDPFVPPVAEVMSQLPSDRARDFKATAGKLGGAFARIAAKVTVSVATAGLVDATGATEAIKSAIAAGIPSPEGLFADQVDAYAEAKQAAAAFKTHLSGAAAALPPSETTTSQPRLIVLIDELDRCTPDFAVRLLERVKHYFQTDGVHFVFGVNRIELGEVVKGRYGTGFDGHKYLDKFFDHGVRLFLHPRSGTTSNWNRVFDKTAGGERNEGAANAISELLSNDIILLDLTYRDLIRLRQAAMAIHPGAVRTYDEQLLLAVLLILKIVSPERYLALLQGAITDEVFRTMFNFASTLSSHSVADASPHNLLYLMAFDLGQPDPSEDGHKALFSAFPAMRPFLRFNAAKNGRARVIRHYARIVDSLGA